jgi:hypothetical protein
LKYSSHLQPDAIRSANRSAASISAGKSLSKGVDLIAAATLNQLIFSAARRDSQHPTAIRRYRRQEHRAHAAWEKMGAANPDWTGGDKP